MLPGKDSFMKISRPVKWIVLFSTMLLFISACATKRYWGPSMGRSADSQLTPTNALEKALKNTSFEAYRGKSIWIDVYSLTERTGEESAEERFLRSWVGEKIVTQGGQIAAAKNQAAILLDVKARIFGVHQTRRDFIPLFYSESTDGIVDLHLTYYESASGKILNTEDIKGDSYYREYYIFYMIGPIKSTK
jgi:hypothetical protein